MGKEKQELYLSELFLQKLNGDFSRKAVIMALEKCNDDILQRLGTYGLAGELIGCFINGGREKQVSSKIKQEISDLLDVYGEFDDMITSKMKRDYLILQII